jgi:diguanylate cyclase (GGDEF)-like protein
VVAFGLALAAFMIVTLGWLVLADLEREGELHREGIGAQQVKDSLHELHVQLVELRHAAREVALSGSAAQAQVIEWRSVEVDAELDYLTLSLSDGMPLPGFQELNESARQLVLQARSIVTQRRAGGEAAALKATVVLDEVADAALRENRRALDAQDNRVNARTLARLRIGENLRNYVQWLLAGAGLVLAGLVASYRLARRREADALRNIERLALWDGVTGLPNRTFLADRLGEEISRGDRHGRRFALLMFDLDGFKDVNDTHGHAAGDRVLAMVGARAARSMRASDVVGRVGGDEFMALLPEATPEGAAAVAEKLRAALAQPYGFGRKTARISSSIGIAYYPEHGREVETLERAADAALYEAKRAGKNRAVVAPFPPVEAQAPREATA